MEVFQGARQPALAPALGSRPDGSNLGHRGALQQLHLGVGRQQIKPLRLPARRQMQVNIVAHHAGGHHRIVLVLHAHLLKGLVSLGVDHRPLFNPANLVLLRSSP